MFDASNADNLSNQLEKNLSPMRVVVGSFYCNVEYNN